MPDEAIRTRQSSGTRAGTGPAPAAAPRHRRRSFAHRGESVAEARRFADETLAGWGVTDRLDDMRLCLSEIATNAVVHVAPPAVGGASAVGAVPAVGGASAAGAVPAAGAIGGGGAGGASSAVGAIGAAGAGGVAGFTVTLIRDAAGVLVEVRDAGDGRPVRHRPGAQDTCGRGLLLVGALADGWGVRQDPAGKTVWLRFALAPEG